MVLRDPEPHRDRPTDGDFEEQLARLAELQTIIDRRAWVARDSMEAYLLLVHERGLRGRIATWDRRFGRD